jgi:hypothetical protein
MEKIEPQALTPEQLEVLRRFASFEGVGVKDVLRSLDGVFTFDFSPERRTASSHFRVPEPGVLITRDHVSKALDQRRLGLISEGELVYWATMILLNDAYEIDSKDHDFVAEWLNNISHDFDPT